MIRYTNHIAHTQKEQENLSQVKNNAGGYSFSLDCWMRLERWLILGAEGGTYYASEKELTKENAKIIEECLRLDGQRTVKTIVKISQSGRAPKTDPAIFALALAASDLNELTRKEAFLALPKVCSTGAHLFRFSKYIDHLRGWGRGLRRAIAKWYTESSLDHVALQVVKYQQCDGWSHRDLLRLSHPQTKDVSRNTLFRWISSRVDGFAKEETICTSPLPSLIEGVERCKKAFTVKEVVQLIVNYQLPHECVPNHFKNEPEVWEALLPHMELTTLICNLGKMSSINLLTPFSDTLKYVQTSLNDINKIQIARIHPLFVLAAFKTYNQEYEEERNLSWQVIPSLRESLRESFNLSFKTIVPTGKKHLLAIDCSNSMDWENVNNMPCSLRQVAATMVMVTARTELNWHVCGFAKKTFPIQITPSMSLAEIVKEFKKTPFRGTDCAGPILWAIEHNIEVDTFVIYTDSETWFGDIHPHKALELYRRQMVKDAKLIVVGMNSNGFSIANPDDAGMLDVVGFDCATPALMADFSRSSLF